MDYILSLLEGDSERFAVKNISVKPDPPVPGKQAVITAEFELCKHQDCSI